MRIAVSLSCIAVISSHLAAQNPSPPATKPDTKTFTADWLPRTRPRDAFADQKGRLWFVGQVGNYVPRLDPATRVIQKFEIDPGTHPPNLDVDPHPTVL